MLCSIECECGRWLGTFWFVSETHASSHTRKRAQFHITALLHVELQLVHHDKSCSTPIS